MSLALILVAVVALAYANGANDNFKGVATLLGSGTTDYRRALAWATVTTLIGSLAAALLAGELLKRFSGRGLVADVLVADPHFVAAVALGAGLTVLLATRLGMPVSTTHGLVGALVGAGWAAGSSVQLAKLGADFFLPLLLSPVIALVAICVLYPAFRLLRVRLGVTESMCICAGNEVLEVMPACWAEPLVIQRVQQLSLSVGTAVTCRKRYQGYVLGLGVGAVLDRLHFLSAGVASFARGLN